MKNIRFYKQSNTLYDLEASMPINQGVLEIFIKKGIPFKVTTPCNQDVTTKFLAKFLNTHYTKINSASLLKLIKREMQ